MSNDRPGPQDSPAFVEIAGISKYFGDVVAVNDVTLTIRRGEILALLGPSGCGKSTLLRIVAGLESPADGEILIDGQPVTGLPPYRRPVNMMFQAYALFPHMTVEQNVAFGLKQEGLDRQVIAERVQRMLDLVRMNDYRRRRPGQLSGGQQQRVALARSLVKEPKLLLLDEPMGALDRKLRADMQFELAEILRRVRVTCMMVTHDAEEAMVMTDRVALMRDGVVVQSGPPQEVYDRPVDRFAAEFLGAVNFFAGTIARLDGPTAEVELTGFGGTVEVPVESAVPVGAAVTVAVRPEDLTLRPAGTGTPPRAFPVTVEDKAFLGIHTTFRVRLPGGARAVVHESDRNIEELLDTGAAAVLLWDPRDGRLLTS